MSFVCFIISISMLATYAPVKVVPEQFGSEIMTQARMMIILTEWLAISGENSANLTPPLTPLKLSKHAVDWATSLSFETSSVAT
jgi:hypothetical protein